MGYLTLHPLQGLFNAECDVTMNIRYCEASVYHVYDDVEVDHLG
jgi:hypothetical protein